MTTSELRTPEMTARIIAAWNVKPFDVYATTETTVTGIDCLEHRGLHVFEDQVLVENLDEGGREVADGEPGARLVVTNLFNLTQPIIRYELSDIARIESGRCSCGRTFRRIVALDGRADDMLTLPGRDGADVTVHPLALRSPFASLADVRQYQVVHDGSRLAVRVVPRDDARPEETVARVRSALTAKLAELGVDVPHIDVEAVSTIARDAGHGGKVKLIVSRRAAERSAQLPSFERFDQNRTTGVAM
jgi:phenylacetate-coenzyme A ligase PaaK-like adenylate-forming protein